MKPAADEHAPLESGGIDPLRPQQAQAQSAQAAGDREGQPAAQSAGPAPSDTAPPDTAPPDTTAPGESAESAASAAEPDEQSMAQEAGVGRHGAGGPAMPSGWAAVRSVLRPRRAWSQVVVGVLCAVLGFGVAIQVAQPRDTRLSAMRDADLVRLLDETSDQSSQVQSDITRLSAERESLQRAADKRKATEAQARQQQQTQGILSGRLPATGPGVRIEITPEGGQLTAASMFNVLEELRNAGAEAIQLNGHRLVTDSSFTSSPQGLSVDGVPLKSPYRWIAIGDPATMQTALEIPGGAMEAVREAKARTSIVQDTSVDVDAVTAPVIPKYATPVPSATQ